MRWTAKSLLPAGSNVYITKLQFSSDSPFGTIRFIQYLDEDVLAVGDDLLVLSGTPGQSGFQLFTVDGTYASGIAHGWYPENTSSATYVGWAADKYSQLVSAITGAGASYSINGNVDTVDLPLRTDSRFPGLRVYGPKDVTSAIAFDLDPAATSATITLFLGGSPGGVLIDPDDFNTDVEDEPLRTPVHTKYNTYLGQWNFLELINAGTEALTVGVNVYNLQGQVMDRTEVSVNGQQEIDVDINNIIRQACTATNPASCAGLSDLDGNGTVDTYGLVRLDFDDTDPDRILLGRMSHYRPDPAGGSFSFAFAREMRNPSQETSYALGNTYDPRGMGFLVPNWLEVINLDSSPLSFLYNLYDQQGTLVFSQAFTFISAGRNRCSSRTRNRGCSAQCR